MKMKRLIFLILLISSNVFPLTLSDSAVSDTLWIAFWNVENLFDTINDPKINDEEFLPGSKNLWTSERYMDKLEKLAQVIRSMKNGSGPDLIGMSEIENKKVLEDLVTLYLKGMQYRIAHLDSPDERGIDVALIYKERAFKLIKLIGHKVELESKSPTRLILEARMKTGRENVSVFVNHWPSRRGGQDDSEKNRVKAASVLKKATQELFGRNANSKIIIMGDFNDEPTNISISSTLDAKNSVCGSNIKENGLLFNLAYPLKLAGFGSYKYRDQWNMLDQIIISTSLFRGSKKINYMCGSFEVYSPGFMVTPDGNYKGSPSRTYAGDKYLGGYSDHFPVIAKFLIK